MKRVTPWILLALVVADPTRICAYVIGTDGNGHPLHWNPSSVGYRLVAGNVPGAAAGEDGARRAFTSWNETASRLALRFDGFAADGEQRFDRRNSVFWVYRDWPYDPAVLAITFRFSDTTDGRLLDTDVVLNAEGYAWSTGGSDFDVEAAVAHEAGHFGGLDHSSDPEATMFGSSAPGETKKRTLAPDDTAGIGAIYGYDSRGESAVGLASGAEGGGGGGCATDGRQTRPGNRVDLLGVIALVFLRWRPRQKRGRARALLPPDH